VNTTLTSVIPTGVRPSALGWSNGVEEPDVSLLRQTACAVGKSVAFAAMLGLVLVWITGIAGAQTTSACESNAQKQLNNLTTSLANGSVANIDILHMQDGMETRASVRPENLERWWESRITLGKVSEWEGRDELVETMKSTKLASNSPIPDLRSAVVFSDSRGNRIVYFGRYFGRYIGQFGGAEGSIGNTPVKFNGGLSTWLKHMIPPSLQ